MKRFSNLASLSLFSLLLSIPVMATDADTILSKNIEALGGKDAAQKFTSYSIIGKVTLVNGMSINSTIYVKEGGKLFVKQDFPSMNTQMVSGCDGQDCYANDPYMGLRLIEGQEKERLLQEDIISSADFKKMYPVRDYRGIESEDGKDFHVIHLKTAGGAETTNYYDSETYLLTKSKIKVAGPMGEVSTVMHYKEYKDYSGYKFPVRIETNLMGIDAVMLISEVEVGIEIPDSKFQLPEGLK